MQSKTRRHGLTDAFTLIPLPGCTKQGQPKAAFINYDKIQNGVFFRTQKFEDFRDIMAFLYAIY